jgi:hypothetical protein
MTWTNTTEQSQDIWLQKCNAFSYNLNSSQLWMQHCGGKFRCKQTGYVSLQKAGFKPADMPLCWMRMPFIPDASTAVLR